MAGTSGFDHIAIAVPDLDAQVERLTAAFGMVVQSRSERYALFADPASGFKIEMNLSEDGEARFRHLGFRSADVDGEHQTLLDASSLKPDTGSATFSWLAAERFAHQCIGAMRL
ncbi:MAG TPA: VOC family protein [Dehalococcoidia bacterium]|nr:VOC family protein [Dehalococcoidia bacterium]